MTDLKALERAPTGTAINWPQLRQLLRFNEAGLIPAIAQEHNTGEVLMFAWMNQTSLERTLRTGDVWYYSRSRAALWHKGESSGHTQRLVEARLDCDADVLLLQVTQQGAACHTGRHSCFYLKVDADGAKVDRDIDIDPASF